MSSELPLVVKAQPVLAISGSGYYNEIEITGKIEDSFSWKALEKPKEWNVGWLAVPYYAVERERLGWEEREKVLVALKEKAERENAELKQKIKELAQDALLCQALDTPNFQEDRQRILVKLTTELLGLMKN